MKFLRTIQLPLLQLTWFFSSLDMPDTALPEALEACSLQEQEVLECKFHPNKVVYRLKTSKTKNIAVWQISTGNFYHMNKQMFKDF